MGSGEKQTFFFENSHWNSEYREFVPDKNPTNLVQLYSYGVGQGAKDGDKAIDLEVENGPLHSYIQYLKEKKLHFQVFIVPGFVPPTSKPVQLHRFAKMRLNSVVKQLNENPGSVALLSGGNVKPENTPFNEAVEMKEYLMQFHKVPEHLIGIEPNAQSTVTNLRNAGRFVLSMGLEKAVVVTTLVQNLYINFPRLTGFDQRSERLLGYSTGDVDYLDLGRALFHPSPKVMEKSPSLIDP